MDKLYDLTELETLAMGDADFLKELLGANIESIQNGLATIPAAYETQDWDTMGKEAHKIKPLLAMLGASEVHKAIVDIEYFTRKEFNPENVKRAFEVFASKAPELLEQLNQAIA